MGSEGVEPSRPIKPTDFKSVVSTIPPRPQNPSFIYYIYIFLDSTQT